ncbi:MAG: sulfotransferase [Sulfuritalea sp.]|nr:sulfotransferase [Sulfuritalea sp.]
MKPCSSTQTLITGVYRTGSEYLAQLVGSHPQVAVGMYSINVLRFVAGRYDPISRRENYLTALTDTAERVQKRYGRVIDIPSILSELDRIERVDYGTFYDVLMCHLYMKSPAKQWAEKNQLLWREIPRFLEMMPNGRAILILRDPRSVLVSFKHYTYAVPPAYLGAIFNCFDAMIYAKRYQLEMPGRVLVVRYEDAANDPQKISEECWRFMELEGTYDVSANQERTDAYGRPWHTNSSFHDGSEARFDVTDSLERWRNRISKAELDLTEGICGELMGEFGYQRSDPQTIDWPQAMKLMIDSPQILSYFRRWLMDGEGIEAFPADPLKPENWRID